MKKVLVFLSVMFCFLVNVEAEEYTDSETLEVKAGETFTIDKIGDLNDAQVLGENWLEITLTDKVNGGFSIPEDQCSAGSEDDSTKTCGNGESYTNWSGISFANVGTYTLVVSYSDGVDNHTNTITVSVSKSTNLVETKSTKNVYVDEEFSISKMNSNAYLQIMHDYIDYSRVDFDPVVMCNTDYLTDAVDMVACFNDKSSFSGLTFLETGVYILYMGYDEVEANNVTYYLEEITFIVTDKIEVSEDETDVVLDNKNTVDQVSDTTITSEVVLPENNLVNNINVSGDEFDNAKNNDVTLVYEIKDTSDKLLYSWTYDSQSLTGAAPADVNLHLNTSDLTEELKEEFDSENALLLSFSHSGDLPGEAKVRIYVGDKFKPNEIVDFYYNNEIDQTIDLMQKGLVVDSEGYVVVTMTHCSDYVLNSTGQFASTGVLDDEPKMGDIDYTYIVLSLIAFMSLSIYFIKKEIKG